MENQDSFEYTYSAPEQEELRKLREKYAPKTDREAKLERLRQLDAGVTAKANAWAIGLGVISTLVMGVGMCCCLEWTELLIPGIFIGIAGMAGISLAYPVYKRILKREQARVAPEILKLTEELM